MVILELLDEDIFLLFVDMSLVSEFFDDGIELLACNLVKHLFMAEERVLFFQFFGLYFMHFDLMEETLLLLPLEFLLVLESILSCKKILLLAFNDYNLVSFDGLVEQILLLLFLLNHNDLFRLVNDFLRCFFFGHWLSLLFKVLFEQICRFWSLSFLFFELVEQPS